MVFAPDDPGVSIGNFAEIAPAFTRLRVWALSNGEESVQELLDETRRLLHSVDAATTVAMTKLEGDEHISELAKHWAFFGRGIFMLMERLPESYIRTSDLVALIGANAFLTARKLTLELNGVDVPLSQPA